MSEHSRVGPLGADGFGEDSGDEGEELFLPADDALHFKYAVSAAGEIDSLDDGGMPGGEKDAVVLQDIGDDEAGEIEGFLPAEFCEV